MKVIVVDDEKLALIDLAEVISEVLPEAEIQVFCSSRKAKEHINENQVDIAFGDIEMKCIFSMRKRLHIETGCSESNSRNY